MTPISTLRIGHDPRINLFILTGGRVADKKKGALFGTEWWKAKDDSKRCYLGQVNAEGISWTPMADMSRTRKNHASVVFQNRVWIIGGNPGMKDQQTTFRGWLPSSLNTTEYIELDPNTGLYLLL